jgi:ATP phosphoribosyltransferase regulatory subunit
VCIPISGIVGRRKEPDVSDRRLHIPQGTEAFYLDEALVHRDLLRCFEDCCSAWGYMPVQTPVLDFHEPYRGLIPEETDTSSYRLVDRDGHLLILRSDATLFLARQMGLKLETEDLPVRVYYGDTILRHEDSHNPSKNEFFQIGAELVGPDGVEADAEAILLLFDALEQMGAGDVLLHIGNHALTDSVGTQGLTSSVAGRDWARTRAVLEVSGAAEARVEELLTLYQFIGPPDELASVIRDMRTLTSVELDTIHRVLSLSTILDDVGPGDRIRIDLSEVGSQRYHSGVVFQAYAPGAGAPIASGGRYDDLLAHFGFDAPSVGFSVMLRRLQSEYAPRTPPEHIKPVCATGATFTKRVRNAQQLRREGKAVHL